MANNEKGPRMIKEILRLKSRGLGKGKIAGALGISKNTVRKYLKQHPSPESGETITKKQYCPIWSEKVDKGVALYVWWEENIKPIEVGDLAKVNYLSLWREWRRKFPKIDLAFHKIHPPGERCEIDFKGDASELGYTDRKTGEFIAAKLFGSVLCFSQKFYAEATHSERQDDFLNATANGFSYFGGVPHLLTFDNAKVAVTRAHRYDPELNKEYVRFCEHYGTAPVQARPRKPKDKNLIECSLGVFWRWARSKIKERTFYSLHELNQFLRELLEEFNDRIQRKYGISRNQKFLFGEEEKLNPLPQLVFEYAEWKKAKLHPDCHVQVGYNFYSAPYTLRSKSLDVRITPSFIEIFYDLERVAIHKKYTGAQRGRYATNSEHLPESHKAMLEFTPQNIIEDANSIGSNTHFFIKKMIEEAEHPLRYLRRAQGITRLRKRLSCDQIEYATKFLNSINKPFAKLSEIENLAKAFDIKQTLKENNTIVRKPNPNLRGNSYWANH